MLAPVHLCAATFFSLSCALTYAYFGNFTQRDAAGKVDQSLAVSPLIVRWCGMTAWVMVMLNLMFMLCAKQYAEEYVGIEERPEWNRHRIDLLIADLWHRFDTNGDNTLSKFECKYMVKELLREGEDLDDDRYAELFAQFDSDGNGYIDRSEMRAFIAHLYADEGSEMDEESNEGEDGYGQIN